MWFLLVPQTNLGHTPKQTMLAFILSSMSHSLYLSVVSEFIVVLSMIRVSVTVQDNSSNIEPTHTLSKIQ